MIYSDEPYNEERASMPFESSDTDRPLPLLEETALLAAQRMSDSAGQLLANTIFELAACVQLMDESPDVAKEGLIALESELRVGLRELRQFVFELNPPFLHKVGLIAALQRYIDRLTQQSDVSIETNLNSESRRSLRSNTGVPKSYEIAIFRIIQEALYTVSERDAVSSVRITVQTSESYLECIVEDDGQWVDVSTIPSDSRLALSHESMRERARIIGGHLTIERGPDDGTRIRLRAPWTSLPGSQ